MQIIDGFFVHESDSWEGSLTYLKSMHETIVDIHQVRPSAAALPFRRPAADR